MTSIRTIFNKELSKKIGEKNATAYERKLYDKCKDTLSEIQIATTYYEVLGRFMVSSSQEDRKVIMDDVKQMRFVVAFDEFEKERFTTNERLVRPPKVAKGAHKCKKCKSEETIGYGLQTRSGDEGMTFFITCIKCNNRWKE